MYTFKIINKAQKTIFLNIKDVFININDERSEGIFRYGFYYPVTRTRGIGGCQKISDRSSDAGTNLDLH